MSWNEPRDSPESQRGDGFGAHAISHSLLSYNIYIYLYIYVYIYIYICLEAG